MATEIPAPPAGKHDAFVARRLDQVRGKIRALDVGRSLLGLGLVIVGYALLMAGCDLVLKDAAPGLLDLLHGIGFVAFVGLSGTFLIQALVRWRRRINPFYAARRLEELVPDAKNSVINYLDLKDQQLPPAFQKAVGQKAARDLKEVEAERATDPRGNWVLLILFLVGLIGLLVLFAGGPGRFGSLMQRAFLPFRNLAIGTTTTITLLEPEGGNVAVPLGQRVLFRARIEGFYPPAHDPNGPRLLLRYHPQDPFVAIPLEEDVDRSWHVIRQPDQVQSGFWYKIAAGDAETPEYQVEVRSPPQAHRFEVVYKHRAYRLLKDAVVVFPNETAVFPRILGHRGTEVELVVRTNVALREGHLDLEFADGTKQTLLGTIRKDDSQAFRVGWVLDKSGVFRIRFTSTENEPNPNGHHPYTLETIADGVPVVELTEPGKDVELPEGGSLALAGTARDDFGLKALTLKLKLLEGGEPDLADLPYRPGKDFRFDDGGYPDFLEYREVLDLKALKTTAGEDFVARAGGVLEYRLEAVDNSDYPSKTGNLGRSAAFRIKIVPPQDQDAKKQEEQRRGQEKKQQEHEKKQDQEHRKENQERQEEAKKKDEPQKGDNADPKTGEGSRQEDQEAQDFEKRARDLKDKLDREKKEQESRGKAKGGEPEKSETKEGAGQPEAKQKDAGKGEGSQGEAKQEEKSGDKGPEPGQARDGGEKQERKQGGTDPAASRPEQKGSKASGQAKGQEGKGDSMKQPGQPQAKPGPSEKHPGQPQAKEKGTGGKQEPQAGQAKAGDEAGTPQPNENAAAQGKGQPQQTPAATAKEGQQGGKKLEDATPQAKQGKGPNDRETAQAKEGGSGKGPEEQAAQSRGPGERNPEAAKGPAQPPQATPEDLASLKKKLEDPKQAEEAAQELSRLAKEAEDRKTREAAKEALQKDGRGTGPGRAKEAPGAAKKNKESAGVGKSGDSGKGMGEKMEPTGPGQARGEGEGKKSDGKPGEGKGEGDAPESAKNDQAGSKAGHYGPGARGIGDENHKKMEATREFGGRGGDLQLDDLLKRLTPEARKKAGVGEEEWRRFLQDAEAYRNWLARNPERAQGPDRLSGGTSKIGSSGPRTVQGSPSGLDPAAAGRPLPPPEYREAQRFFTTRPGRKDP